VAAGQRMDLADVGEHVDHAPHVAISRGPLEKGGDVAGIHLERAVEPGKRGGEAILAPAQFAAKLQRIGIAGPGGDGAVDRLDRAGDIAVRAAEAGDVGPQVAVLGRRIDRAGELGGGIGAVAERRISAAGDAGGVGEMRGRGGGGFAQRTLRVALEEPGVGEQVGGLGGGNARLAGADDLRFRRDPVAEREIDPRLHDAGRLVVRIGLERVQQLDPRGADIAGLEGGDAPLVRRARSARTGGEQGEAEKERRRPHGCSPYCLRRS